MRKTIVQILSCLVIACSSGIEDIMVDDFSEETPTGKSLDATANKPPIINSRAFSVPEHSKEGMSIGFIKASDIDGDEITYTVASDGDVTLDENTGELKVGAKLKLDYETAQNLEFTISAFDGKTITDKEINLAVEDIDENSLLTEDQKELITYFEHLVFWKGTGNSSVKHNQKWESTMKLYLDGTISKEFKTIVENVIAQYNTLTVDGDFSISLVENSFEANATLFFGTKEELENFWPDMYQEIKSSSYDGFSMTPSANSILTSTRIWISNPIEALLKHELGHALGFGHSNKCEGERSFLCSQISTDNDFLTVEEDIIRLLYHSQIPAGLSETEIRMVLANLILNEQK